MSTVCLVRSPVSASKDLGLGTLRRSLRGFALSCCASCVVAAPSWAVTYTDDFATGLNPAFWNPNTNQPLYTLNDSQGDLRIGKPVGGTHTFQAMNLDFRGDLTGDFAAEVDFSNAFITRVDGTPGNQVQLNATFGGQFFGVVRSDESPGGQTVHVFVSPPGAWMGTQANTATSGRFRIVRTGTTVAGYLGSTLIHSGSYNGSPVDRLWFSLQNNGTVDSTSVRFDNFFASGQITTSATMAVPEQAERLSVFPNPVTSFARVSYRIDVPGHVRLSLYNVSGRRVTTLFDHDVPAGPHTVGWSPSANVARGPALSGVYFVVMEHGDRTVVQKVALVR